MKRLAIHLVALAALASGLRAELFIVDATGNGDFQDIQPAVDAATDGDTILVRPGVYGGFVINRKSVNVVGDSPGLVSVVGGLRVRRLLPGQLALVTGLDVTGVDTGFPADSFAGLFTDNDGAVRIEKCRLTSADGSQGSFSDGWHGLSVIDSEDVVLVDCELAGGLSFLFGNCYFFGTNQRSGNGIQAQGSNVTLYDSTALAGLGYTGCDGGPGGNGLEVIGGTAFAANCVLQGGDGGDGECTGGSLGGDGGNGLELVDNSQMTEAANQLVVGWGGGHTSGLILGAPGCNGVSANVDVTSSLDSLPIATARMLTLSSPIVEGTPLGVTVSGAPGDQVILLLSSASANEVNPLALGMQLVGQPLIRRYDLGVLDATGSKLVQIPLPNVPAQDGAEAWFLQAYVVAQDGTALLSSGRAAVVLDSGT